MCSCLDTDNGPLLFQFFVVKILLLFSSKFSTHAVSDLELNCREVSRFRTKTKL